MRTTNTRTTWTCVVALAAALAGCATYEKCGLEGCPDDVKLTAQVQTALAQHPELESVRVKTLNHIVYLTGSVSDSLMSATAQSIASQTKGVTEVENSVYVSR